MRFVEHPGANFTMHQRIGKSRATELLRCHKNQSKIPQAELVEHQPTLHRIQQAVQVTGAGDTSFFEIIDLVFH
jgi:hypothetical protein